MAIEVRDLSLEDISAVRQMLYYSFQEYEVLDAMSKMPPNYICKVAIDTTLDGVIIGYICYKRTLYTVWDICWLVTHYDHGRRGVGKKLVDACKADVLAREYPGGIRLEAAEGNESACKFYEKLGFTKVGKIDNFYDWGHGMVLYYLPVGF